QLVDDRSRANVVFFDVQPGEVEGVSSILEAQAAPVLDRVPIVSMRIERINGESVAAMEADSTTHVSWAHRRDYRSTYRGTLSDTERLVAGRFTGALEPGQAPVPISVEVDVARELNVDLGDTIVWNVHGLP